MPPINTDARHAAFATRSFSPARISPKSHIALVSFKWVPLEEYLVATNSALVRMFDFTFFRRGDFSSWSDDPDELVDLGSLFCRRKVMPDRAGYARGVQIVSPRQKQDDPFGEAVGVARKKKEKHVEFTAYDWRNRQVATISTDPAATANYFNGQGNSLPYELSPAFFRPEVLLKYKTDRDKYTVGDRDVSCRAAWHLRGIDVNEAGQVHAYICDLRCLPYAEKLHWLSFNEEPKTGISERAVVSDFKGEFTENLDPLQEVLFIIRRWRNDAVDWWHLRDESLMERVTIPVSSSRDEWAEAFMDLAKLVVEGFETRPNRARLDAVKVQYEQDDRTIALIEKFLDHNNGAEEKSRMVGLRTVQNLRSKAKGHAGGSEASKLANDALTERGTFANHFRFVCTQVSAELRTIELALAGRQPEPGG